VVAVGTGEMIELPCNLVLRSIGYKSQPLEGVRFDRKKAVVPNRQGRVLVEAAPAAGALAAAVGVGEVVPGMYCKRGPTGIINTNIYDARETVASIVEDAGQGKLSPPSSPLSSFLEVLAKGGMKKVGEVVTWEGYQKIDAYECKVGATRGKPREKVIDAQELVRIATK
jgi:adrenodoxin-NADP+ reductase